MQTVRTIGLDIAKSVFQVHGVDAAGNVIVRRQLKRRYVLPFFQKLPPCLIGIEACASSHHWAFRSGHDFSAWISANEAIAICAACSPLARWR
jgi:transposase